MQVRRYSRICALQMQMLGDVMSPHMDSKMFTYFPSRSSDGTYLLASTELVLIHSDRDSSKADLRKVVDVMSSRQVNLIHHKFS